MSNKSNLLTLLNEIILEVGDLENINLIDYQKTHSGGKFVTQIDGKDIRVSVNITKWPTSLNHQLEFPPIITPNPNSIFNVGYSLEGEDTQFTKSSFKDLIYILKTVSEITKKQFLSKLDTNPTFIMFATDKKGEGYEDPQKLNLYRAILSKQLPTGARMGYGNNISLKVKFLYLSKIK